MQLIRHLMTAALLIGLAGCGSDFDYATATEEEQSEWLSWQADTIRSGAKAGLWSSGAAGIVKIDEPVVQARSKRIVISARLKSKDIQINTNTGKIKTALLGSMCPVYLESALGQEGIKVVFDIVRFDGGRILGVEGNPSSCAKYGT